MELEEHAESLAYEIAFWMEGLMNPEYPIDEIGRLSMEISDKLRSLSIIILLSTGDSDLFYHNLIRSALARKQYLKRVSKEKMTGDHHFVSSRFEPLLDAIAANELNLASHIAALSPDQWAAKREYEDDFCYVQILFQLIRPAVPDAEINRYFKQYESWLNGETHARLNVCRAIADVDQANFETAFNDLIHERELEIEKNKARGQLEDPQVVSQRQIYIEGLALLRLAELRGLRTEPEYLFCPSIARAPMKTPFPGE